jgi:hypothetical protein
MTELLKKLLANGRTIAGMLDKALPLEREQKTTADRPSAFFGCAMQKSGIPEKKGCSTPVRQSAAPGARYAGITVVEAVVILFIVGMGLSLVIFSSAFVASTSLLQKRKSTLHAQTELAASAIANDIRTSQQVIFFNPGGITFIASGGDTVTYRFSRDSLRKNGATFPFVSDGAKVVKFSIEKEGPPLDSATPGEQNQPQDVELIVTLGTKDRTGTMSEARGRVTVRYAVDTNTADKSKWNY